MTNQPNPALQSALTRHIGGIFELQEVLLHMEHENGTDSLTEAARRTLYDCSGAIRSIAEQAGRAQA